MPTVLERFSKALVSTLNIFIENACNSLSVPEWDKIEYLFYKSVSINDIERFDVPDTDFREKLEFRTEGLSRYKFPYSDYEDSSVYIDKAPDNYVAVLSPYSVDSDILQSVSDNYTRFFPMRYKFDTFLYINTDNLNVCFTGFRGKRNIVLFNIKSLLSELDFNLADDDYLKSYFKNRPLSRDSLDKILYDLIIFSYKPNYQKIIRFMFNKVSIDINRDCIDFIRSFVSYAVYQGFILFYIFSYNQNIKFVDDLLSEWSHLPILLINPNTLAYHNDFYLHYILYTMYNSIGRGKEIKKFYHSYKAPLSLKSIFNYNLSKFIPETIGVYKDMENSCSHFTDNCKLLTYSDLKVLASYRFKGVQSTTIGKKFRVYFPYVEDYHIINFNFEFF